MIARPYLRIVHFEDQPTQVDWIGEALLNRFIRICPDVLERLDDSPDNENSLVIPGYLSKREFDLEYIIYKNPSEYDDEISRMHEKVIFILDVNMGGNVDGTDLWERLNNEEKIDVDRQVLFLTAYPAEIHENLDLSPDYCNIVRKPPNHVDFVDILCDRLVHLLEA